MRILELFSGTESISKSFRENGHETTTVDNNRKSFDADWKTDLSVELDQMWLEDIGDFDILWASPPCQGFSIASCYRHWRIIEGKYIPQTQKALDSLSMVENTLRIINIKKPKYWFIENPRGMLRKMIDVLFKKHGIEAKRWTVTYCQYGDKRMKPTDIWTNHPNWFPLEPCKNGMPCHVSAPRGSPTGTQGLKNNIERSRIPVLLCNEIRRICEKWF